MSPYKVNRKNIWNYKQNKVSLIVKDLAGSDKEEDSLRTSLYQVLLARGVFKWFAVRRGIIVLKNRWKERIKNSLEAQKNSETGRQRAYWKGYRAALEEARAEVRALCHSDRWSVDPKDRSASRWLVEQAEKAEQKQG